MLPDKFFVLDGLGHATPVLYDAADLAAGTAQLPGEEATNPIAALPPYPPQEGVLACLAPAPKS
eukprot:10320557-Karenia_brevis.AAC.1